ncbi:MAG: hypothetical protein AAGB22_11850, partial [Bacteroidota bacterium]
MRTLFRDPQLQSRFDAQGYVVVPLLADDAVEALRQQFHREFPETPPAFFPPATCRNLRANSKSA